MRKLVALLIALASADPAVAQTTAADFVNPGWSQSATLVRPNLTSTSTLRLPNGLVRTYQNPRADAVPGGRFAYSDSVDGTNLSTAKGVSLPASAPNGFNPAVARLHDGTYLLIYNLSNPSNGGLVAAKSSDGATFGATVALPSSSLDVNPGGAVFQSVPSILVNPDGSVRVYYVANGKSTASQLSTDGGVTWVPDAGYRLAPPTLNGASQAFADPCVVSLPDGTRALFYTNFQPAPSVGAGEIRVATASDGLTFAAVPGKAIAAPDASITNALVDPDVYQTADGVWHMLAGVGASQNQINLYHTTWPGSPASTVLPQTGWWWNPKEGGRGFAIETRGNNLFMAGFMYAGDGTPIWYVSNGVMVNSYTYFGTIQQYAGSATLNGFGPVRALGSVGAISLVFSANGAATMTWPGGVVPLQRYEFVTAGLTKPARAGMPQSGWWWNANEGGRGYFLEVQDGGLFFAAYMYDGRDQATWYITQGAMASTSLYQGTLQTYGGGQTLTGAFRQATSGPDAGAITLQFSDTANGTITLPNGSKIAITRYTF